MCPHNLICKYWKGRKISESRLGKKTEKSKRKGKFQLWFKGQTSANAGSPTSKNYAPCTLFGAPRRVGPSQSAGRRPTLGGLPSWSQFLQCIVSMKERATFPPFIRSERCRGRRENCIIAITLANQRLNSRHSAAKSRKFQCSCLKFTKLKGTDERSLAESLLTIGEC